MSNIKLNTTVRNNMMDELTTEVGANGKIKIYTGAQPATGGGAPTGALLGTLTCSATFAASAAGGAITLNAVTQDSAADATGEASWFRLTKSDDTFVMDGDITITGGNGDLELNDTSVVIGGTIALPPANTLTMGNT